jgi:hypothetical protein
MADHSRYSKHMALENAARRSLRPDRMTKPYWHSKLVAFIAAAARRLANPHRRAPVVAPVATVRFKSATS